MSPQTGLPVFSRFGHLLGRRVALRLYLTSESYTRYVNTPPVNENLSSTSLERREK